MSGIGNQRKGRGFNTARADAFPFVIDAVYGCHVWTGTLDKDGYAVIGRRMAHRVIWESHYGAIPDGHMLDHICRRRDCVNVRDHLEPVKQSENEMRKSMRYRLRRKACKHGHPYTMLTSMITPQGGRVCRECLR